MKNYGQDYVVGVEAEGFIVNGQRAKERIHELPASEWLMDRVKAVIPELADNLSFEQASVMIEVKSDTFPEETEAVRQVLVIRGVLDRILEEVGCKLIFEPILKEDFEFVAATSDPNSRAQQLIHEWGGDTPEGLRKLKSTVVAGLQVNDSRPYKGIDGYDERLELSRRIHNLYTENFEVLDRENGKIRNFEGLSRMDKLRILIPEVKKDRFAAHGYTDPLVAAFPGHFPTVEAMQKWMMAHSGVTRFMDADSKNEHGLLVKTKRPKNSHGAWIAESRIDDAVDDGTAMLRLANRNTRLLRQLEQ